MKAGKQTGGTSWVDTRVRRDGVYGTVIEDYNARLRTLTVRMDNGELAEIVMNNMGPDPNLNELRSWEWLWDKTKDQKWYRF